MDIFCKILNGEIPSNKLYEDDFVMVIMDVNPRSNGHCLVIAKKHYDDIYDVDNDTLVHMWDVARDINKMIEENYIVMGLLLNLIMVLLKKLNIFIYILFLDINMKIL